MSVNLRESFDFSIERGDSLTIELGPVTTRDKDGNKDAVDLTAVDHLRLTVKRSTADADSDAVAQVDEADGITVDSPTTAEKNYATAFIDKDTFDGDEFADRTELVWDAEFEVSDRRETFTRGRITVNPDVTRDDTP